VRLGIVTTSYPREPGDPAGSFVGAHVRWLRAQGHEVEVLAAGAPEAGDPVHRIRSRLFYRGGAPEALERGGALIAAAAAGFSLRQLAAISRRIPRWDAVCAHWLAPSGVATAAALLARQRRLPLLAVAHSGDVHFLDRLHAAPAAGRLMLAAGARFAFSSGKLARRMVAASGRAGEAIAERTLICPMGVELSPVPPPARRSGSRCRLLFLGRLVPIKGVDVLLRALACLGPSFELIVAGEGPARSDIAALARELGLGARARLVGEVRGPLKDGLLATADVLVLPSLELPGGRAEGMPVAVLEAIAAGCPAVVSRSGGLEELPESVPKVEPGDPVALAAALRPLADPEARHRLWRRQQPIAEAQRWDRVGAKLWRHWVGQSASPRRRTA
jgi:glycosyltransferase involved in cell wall biosynthesis